MREEFDFDAASVVFNNHFRHGVLTFLATILPHSSSRFCLLLSSRKIKQKTTTNSKEHASTSPFSLHSVILLVLLAIVLSPMEG